MSLLIQQEDQGQGIYSPSFNAFAFKKIFNEAGMFEANFHLKSSNNRLEIHRLFDIDLRYKFTVNIQILKDRLIFGSSLLKNSQIQVVRDITTRLIYWRLINKYFVENGLIITLTNEGQFMTKKVIFFQHFASTKCSARKYTEQQIKLTLFSFIQQTVLFYKCVIPKLQGDIVEISKSRVNYIKKYFMAVNLCNHSFFPTLEIYCKQAGDGHDMSNISEKRFKSSTKNNNDVKKSFTQNNNFMYHNDSAQLVYNQQKQANKYSSPESIIEDFDILQMYQKIIQYKQKCETSMVQININPKSQPQLYLYYKTFVTNLEIAFSKKDSRQSKIYNPVNIFSPQLISWQPFDSTSLSQLKIAKVKYIYAQNQIDKNQITQTKVSKRRQQLQSQQSFQSTMILKHQPIFKSQQKPHFFGQLKWQKTIIQQCFKNDFCVYMTRFFIPVQQERPILKNVQNFILSQFMKRGTLQKWLTENSYLSSIFTKINIILYILYGVTFLHSKKVLHMDLKPQNILMDKSLVPKLTDFGSAYNKLVYEKMRKQKHHYYLSFSIPYTAPQIFMKSHKPQINAKCDIFSLGLIIYEILFNRSILGESNNLEKMFKDIGRKLDLWQDHKQKYGQSNYIEQTLHSKIFICPQDMSQQYQVLILNLILRCLSCDQQKRPNLGMLIISLKQIFQMLIQFFAW